MKQSILAVFIFLTALCSSEDITTIHSPNESFVIESELGRGAFGIVYAVHDSHGNPFALKKLIPYGYSGRTIEMYEDAQREFSNGQSLNHPNIIKSIDWFIDEEEFQYVLLELVKGKRFHSIKRRALTGEQAIKLSLQLIDALQYAFQMGYLYLDMHSDNVMFTEAFDTKIIDLASFFSVDELCFLSSKKAIRNPKGMHEDNLPLREVKFNHFFAMHQESFNKIITSKSLLSREIPRYFFYLNINDYIRITINIIGKSDMERGKKIDLLAELRKVGWNYEEDYEEGIDLPAGEYLKKIKDVLENS